MARTSVLTGGSNSAQTTSEDLNGLSTDLLNDGVVGSIANTSGIAPSTGGLAINAQGSPNTTTAVTAGIAYVTATPTSQGSQRLRVKIDAQNVTHASNSSGSTRYDWIYVSVDAALAANPISDMSTTGTVVVSRSSSNTTDNGTPPTYGLNIAIVTLANSFSSVTNSNIADKRQRTGVTVSNGSDGWTLASETWTYASATTITVPTDATNKYSVGDKIRLKQGGSYKYFYVVGVAATVLTITGGTDYTFTNATVTDNYYSKLGTPVGFPHWFNYTPSYVGFSANPSGGMGARFVMIGRLLKVDHNPSTGTSNATSFTISLPVTAATLSGGVWRQFGKAVDNGSTLNTGFVEILTGATTATVYKDQNGTGWTASSTKTYQGYFEYEI